MSLAFREFCAEFDLVADKDTPHGEAFYAGWQAGRDDGIDVTLTAARRHP